MKKNKVFADRKQFVDCCKGDLLIRNAEGRLTHLGDGASFAMEAAERGEPVFLTVNGVTVSVVVNGKESLYKESLYKERT